MGLFPPCGVDGGGGGADSVLQYIQAMRLFKDEPKWTPLNRSEELDSNLQRKDYVSQFLS